MPNHNYVCLVGHLTRDVELAYTPSQTAVAKGGIAVTEKWKNKNTGQMQESTCFVDWEAWAGLGETLNKYFKKGDPILISGTLAYDTWTDKTTGAKRGRHKIKVTGFTFIKSQQAKPAPSTPPLPSLDPDGDVPF